MDAFTIRRTKMLAFVSFFFFFLLFFFSIGKNQGRQKLPEERQPDSPDGVALTNGELPSFCRNGNFSSELISVLASPSDDDLAATFIRKYLLRRESGRMAKMSMPLFQTPQAQHIDRLLHGKTGGTFVECGALDGERSSNTIWLEQKRQWRGLLIEMDRSWYTQLVGKNRKADSLNACISPDARSRKLEFVEHRMGEGKLGQSGGDGDRNNGGRKQYALCFSFAAIMKAAGITHIDYFSLDVEGLELEVLRSIPFNEIRIDALTVEFKHGSGGGSEYIEFMKSKGYRMQKRIKESIPSIYFGCDDYLFVRHGA